ncbi:hypothetical protein D3Y59_04170 [Hymenobacter oligotrophus]|uniref:Uncharacterized protein n=1 Tax=Hymenobacter oligotrophus TaxID=2319843 RepID=A0A3B7QTJ1_9BACT|nr:hypothetical protein [Hymenobacter oligotrophus]AYA36328.1 hypothetical protein D3Y59_04170 [Hymenobacter oligotrophus]
MRPEDIDKLFRDKLEQHTTPPPANLWYDLQEQLEPQEEKRRGGFWMYAVAAAITLLLVAGGGWLMWRTGGLPQQGTSASAPLASHSAKPAPQTTDNELPTSPAPVGTGTQPNLGAAPQSPAVAARPDASGASGNVATLATPKRKTRQYMARNAQPTLAGTKRAAARLQPAETVVPLPAPASQPQAVAAAAVQAPAPTTTSPALAPASSSTAVAAASQSIAGPIEVEVRQQPAAVAVAAAEVTPRGRTRPTVFGVIKQVSKIARGEKPNLTEVGLPANPALTLQAHVGNRTLTKTISL